MNGIISSYCRIKDNRVRLNGKLLLERPGEDLPAFLGTLYRHMELNYPKFFKMDKLCKLGLVASEAVIRATPEFDALDKTRIALVFANNASSLDSDRNHASTIADKQNYFPSPSVFVYTLPNIVIGEISIKHKITGENAFFVSGSFDAGLLYEYTCILFADRTTEAAVCGWVNVDGDSAEAFVYCVKNTNFNQENSPGHHRDQKSHNPGEIQHLYNS